MKHQTVAKIVGFLRRQQSAQIILYLNGDFAFRQAKPPADADAVGIRYHSRFVVNVADHKVRGFPSNAGQLYQLLHRVRHNPAVLFRQHFAGALDVLRLCFIKPAGADQFFNFLYSSVVKGFQVREACKQRGGHHVHAGVRALGGKPGGDQKLERVTVFQRTYRVRIFLFQRFHSHQSGLLFRHSFMHPFPFPAAQRPSSRLSAFFVCRFNSIFYFNTKSGKGKEAILGFA